MTSITDEYVLSKQKKAREKDDSQARASFLQKRREQRTARLARQTEELDPLPIWLEQGICQRCGFGDECEARKRMELAQWARGVWQAIRPTPCSPEHPANREWRAKYAHSKA